MQIPGWDARVIDLDQAAASRGYCDDYRGKLAELGLEITELAGYLQGQVLAMHPAYDGRLRRVSSARAWRARRAPSGPPSELKKCIRASANLGLRNIPVLSGGFAWHLAYPWPQRPPG